MAQSQILGLFANPRSVEDAVRQQIRQSAPKFENASNQRLFNAIAEAGAAFDPRVQQARQQQEIAKSVTGEFGSSKYYYGLAEQFRQRGMLQSAVVAADKAKSIEKATMDKAMAKYGSISFKDYDAQAPMIRRLIMQIEKTTDPDVRTELERQLEQAMKDGGDLVAKREAKEVGAEESAKLESQRYDKALQNVQDQFTSANTQDETVFNIRTRIVDNLENINTGFGANAITGFQALARAVGIVDGSSEYAQLSANTQSAQAIIGQLMLNQIKTLGTNPSNADREFLMKTLPSVTNEPKAIKKIADYLEARAIFAREDAKAKLDHLENNRNLVSYETPKEIYTKLQKFYDEAEVVPDQTKMSDADLEDGRRDQLVIRDVEEPKQAQPLSAQETVQKAKENQGQDPAPPRPVPRLIPIMLSSKAAQEVNLNEKGIYDMLIQRLNNGQMLNPDQADAFEYLDDIYGGQ